jgi:hypothetical protein
VGRRGEALGELRRAYEEKSWAVLLLGVDPLACALRMDPQVTALRKKMLSDAQT